VISLHFFTKTCRLLSTEWAVGTCC